MALLIEYAADEGIYPKGAQFIVADEQARAALHPAAVVVRELAPGGDVAADAALAAPENADRPLGPDEYVIGEGTAWPPPDPADEHVPQRRRAAKKDDEGE